MALIAAPGHVSGVGRKDKAREALIKPQSPQTHVAEHSTPHPNLASLAVNAAPGHVSDVGRRDRAESSRAPPHRARDDEAHHRDGLVLPQTVDTVCCLRLTGGVPPDGNYSWKHVSGYRVQTSGTKV